MCVNSGCARHFSAKAGDRSRQVAPAGAIQSTGRQTDDCPRHAGPCHPPTGFCAAEVAVRGSRHEHQHRPQGGIPFVPCRPGVNRRTRSAVLATAGIAGSLTLAMGQTQGPMGQTQGGSPPPSNSQSVPADGRSSPSDNTRKVRPAIPQDRLNTPIQQPSSPQGPQSGGPK